MAAKTFGAFFKECRVATGMTLRAFCERNKVDPGNLSKLERGIFPPPELDSKIEEYAVMLGLKRGSSVWYEFFDLAAAERGRIPKDLLSDDELLGKLPVLFRTLRGAKVSDRHLDQLIERIRRA
ncbi:MAG: helix-turn-helix transcriptional regulator [Planctomycetota bacterium]